MISLPHPNVRTIVIGVVCFVLILGAFAGLFLSVYRFRSEDRVTRTVASFFRLPVARVGRVNVLYSDYLAHLQSVRTFLSGPAAAAQGLSGAVGPTEEKTVLDRAIRIAAVQELAQQADLVATQLDAERAFAGLVAQAGTSTTAGEIQDFLRDQFGWNERDFKQYVIRPALLEDALRAKRTRETGDETAFDRELEERLKRSDVFTYVTF